jgi:hypothetical protein
MTTSGVYTFTVTVNDIVTAAMQNLGKLGENEGPSSKDFADCTMRLNTIIKQLQGSSDYSRGIKMWTRRKGYLLLSSTTGQYTIGPTGDNWTNTLNITSLLYNAAVGAGAVTVVNSANISTNDYIGIQLSTGDLFWTTVSSVVGASINLTSTLTASAGVGAVVYTYTAKAQFPISTEYAFLRDSSNNDVPLKFLDLQQYAMLPSKADPTNISDPTAIYIENQLSNSVLYIDCGAAADVTKYIVIGYQESIQDLSGAPAETIEYPQEYYRAIIWLLTREICPMYNGVWTQLMESITKEAISIATNKDPRTSTLYFQPGVY